MVQYITTSNYYYYYPLSPTRVRGRIYTTTISSKWRYQRWRISGYDTLDEEMRSEDEIEVMISTMRS